MKKDELSRQVNFFMHPEDLAEFEQVVRSKGDVAFIPYQLKEPRVTTLPSLRIVKPGEDWLTVFLARMEHLGTLTFSYVKEQSYWSVDDSRSLVVEFSRCYFDGQKLRRGRLYVQTGYYDQNGKWVEKPHAFLKRADQLLGWIRKNYMKDKKTGFYVGPAAEGFRSQGGNLVVL